ncbi:MAG: SDR family oxidoreductase [Spirochaetales bacterium]|nr:SDR family oxidoreductase [Spirochaetales bacterium]
MKLKDTISIVTGAATGIGRATAIKFAEHGSTVILADINLDGIKKTSEIIEEKGYSGIPIKIDLTSLSYIKSFTSKVISQFKRIDILVNNAGIFSTLPILEMTEQEWDLVMGVNLKGTFFLCKEILPIMIKQRSGKIINLSSLAAKRGGVTSGINYAASKAGIISVTKCLAKFAASYGINVNAVVPAFCDTNMFRSLPKEKIESAIKGIPLGRPAQPEELADAILFLASDEASYITGEILDVNGGVLMD